MRVREGGAAVRPDAGTPVAEATPPLSSEFYGRGAQEVARGLLGCVVARRIDGVWRRARLVETEAYVGQHDLACHSSRGRTRRTEVMFGPPGRAYVYLVYGMHLMVNVVTGAEGDAQAVLLRAGEPLDGLAERTNGPALLARALGVTLRENGADLVTSDLRIFPGFPPRRVVTTPRIGVGYAGDWAAAPLRFLDGDSRCVSRGAPDASVDRLRLAGGKGDRTSSIGE